MKKRFVALLLALGLLLGCASAVRAADAPRVFVGNVSARAGETVEVPVYLSGCGGFMSLALAIGYDADAMTLLGAENAAPGGAYWVTSEYYSANPYVLLWLSTANVQYNGVLATLTFRLHADASGEYPVTVAAYHGRDGDYDDDTLNYDEENKPLGLQFAPGVVEAAEHARTVQVSVGSRQAALTAEHPLRGEIWAVAYRASGQFAAAYSCPAAETVQLPEITGGGTVKLLWLDGGLPVCPAETLTLQ